MMSVICSLHVSLVIGREKSKPIIHRNRSYRLLKKTIAMADHLRVRACASGLVLFFSDVHKMTREYSTLLKSRDGERASKTKTELRRTKGKEKQKTNIVVFIILFRCNTSREKKKKDFQV